jgi:hypothetical protein
MAHGSCIGPARLAPQSCAADEHRATCCNQRGARICVVEACRKRGELAKRGGRMQLVRTKESQASSGLEVMKRAWQSGLTEGLMAHMHMLARPPPTRCGGLLGAEQGGAREGLGLGPGGLLASIASILLIRIAFGHGTPGGNTRLQ